MRSSGNVRFIAVFALTTVMLAACLYQTAGRAATEKEVKEFIARIQDGNADVRYAAWRSAGNVGAAAVVPLGALVAGENRGVAKAACEALNTIAHHASRPGAGAERKAVSREVVKLLGDGQPYATRVKALELLALIADDESVPPIARLLEDERLREDARRALERIPGEASVQALIAGLKKAPEKFRPAIIHSLGEKGAKGALGVLVESAEGPDKATAVAAFDALSQVGDVGDRGPQPIVQWGELSPREKRAMVSAFLRFAERRADKGDTDLALGIYRGVLSRATEEHYKCAGLVGLGKVGSASTVDTILPALADGSAAVCQAAEEALISMKDPDVDAALQKALETASPDAKDVILRILSARKSR